MSTYASNDDVQSRVPFTISSTSSPTTSKIASMRTQAKALIYSRLGSAPTDAGNRLLTLEVTLVLRFLAQYYALGRGEPYFEVAITDEDWQFYQLDDFLDEDDYGGGHVSVKI